jgi:uncharacterized protein with HEPN domain
MSGNRSFMPRKFVHYLEDIVSAAAKIQLYTQGMDCAAFTKNALVTDAVLRNLEVIGEAAKKVPRPIRTQYPQVEWKKIGALRDILIHEYFGVNFEILWDIISNKVPILRGQIEQILEELRGKELPFG